MFKLCNSDDFKIKFRLSKGMIAMFDNLRLLHGRTKFDPNTGLDIYKDVILTMM